MSKLVVLKPVAWNNNGYVSPCGIDKRGNDYVAQHGFGHEEWNNAPGRIWNGQRVFHTERPDKMVEYGDRGVLGIVMTAYAPNRGGPHAVGIATSVKANLDDERAKIAAHLGTLGMAEQIWNVPSVQDERRHPHFNEFLAFWNKEHAWIGWRCPPEQFAWFDTPIQLDPKLLFPAPPGERSPQIIKMYNACMPITPEQALSIVWNSLDANSPIISWLRAIDFDNAQVAKKTMSFAKPEPHPGTRRHHNAPPASGPYVRYMCEQELVITPRHAELQNRFKAFAEQDGATRIMEDEAGVDIQFFLPARGLILAEVKPCNEGTARFAIRAAIGQLLDYRQRHAENPKHLMIVVQTRPTDEDSRLATKNGFAIAYPHGRDFTIEWPG